ncbi:hypothetical protein OUW_20586 [Mycobacteroides abscessus M93]|nr:hypothetical protein OUW_20586 [Mycobacteroides abscessus M93]
MAKKANDYMAVVDTWHPEAGQFKDVFDEYKRWVGAPNGTEWTGRTSNAAYDTASTDCHSSDNTNDTAEDAGKLVAATIEYEVVDPLVNGQRLIERVLEHKDRGVSIDQQYHVEYHPAEGESDESIARNREHVADIERQIKDYVAKWEQGCQTLKAQADAAAQKITGCINPKTALVDGRKILRDAVNPTPGEGPSTVTAASGKPHGIVEGMQDIAGVGDTKPAGTTAAETVADYKKWYPKDAVPVGDKNVDPAKLGGVGSLPGVRDGSDKTPQPLQRAVLRPEQIEQFKADTRKLLQGQGVPADQIESRVNAAVQSAQNPHFMPDAEPMRTPGQVPLHNSPGDQFNDIVGRANDSATKTIDGQIEQAKVLTGQAGPGAPGVAEAWKQVGLGAVQQVHELTSDPLAAPKMGIEQAKEFYNHPGEFIGKNLIHGTEALGGGAIGGEAAAGARGLLGDLTGTEGRALTHGLDDASPGHHTPAGGDHPGGGRPGPEHGVPAAAEHSVGPLRSADEILHEARDAHRAERDQMDWHRGEQNLQDLATHHGVSVDELPRTPQYDIDHPTYTDKHAAEHAAEIDRQTQLWEHGFNTQSVQQVLDNMDATRPPSTGLRDELREGLSDYGYEDLRKAGYGPQQAEQLAKTYANEQFPKDSGLIEQPVIHNPDGAIGGYKDALTYGDWQVNNALGNLTKQEKDALRAWLQTQDPNAIVNINLGRR